MPSIKPRINLTVPVRTERALTRVAERDGQSVSAKALSLIELALSFDEDAQLLSLAQERDTRGVKYLSSDEAWA